MSNTRNDPQWHGKYTDCAECGCEHAGGRSYEEPTLCDACHGHEAGMGAGMAAERRRILIGLDDYEQRCQDSACMEPEAVEEALRTCAALREIIKGEVKALGKRILITGSRDWADREKVREALLKYGPGIVVHGACTGADTIAAEVATELGWEVEAWPADWGKHGKRAGPLRNQTMVSAGADVCLAFPLPDSVGTRDCIDRAARAGIPVKAFPL